MSSTKTYRANDPTVFEKITRDINELYNSVNSPQVSGGRGTEGKSGDLRLTFDDGGYSYLEGKGNEGWLTSFTGVMVDKPARGRPYPHFPVLTVDNLFAKIFTVNQTMSSNGNMIMSDYGIVESFTKSTITFKDQTNLNLCGFQQYDTCEVRSIKADKSLDIKKINFTVDSVSGRTITVTYSGSDLVSVGDIVVRIGNTTTASRQNSIYFSTSDTNSPYIDLYSGTTLYTLSSPKVRVGKLDGVGALTGMGLYAIDNIHLSKIAAGVGIHLTTGTTTTITSGFAVFDPAEGRMHLGDTTNYIRWNYDETAPFKDKLVVQGDIVLGNTNSIYSANKTSYADTDAGFWLGYDTSAYKINFGDATNYFKWTGTAIETLGATITGGTIQTATGTGQRVVMDNTNGGQIRFYNSSNVNIIKIGDAAFSSTPGMLVTNGMVYSTTNVSSSYALYGASSGAISAVGIQGDATGLGINYAVKGYAVAGTSNYSFYGEAGTLLNVEGLNIGASKFIVSATGDITKLNNITYAFPSVAPTLSQVLACSNATGGVLSWASPGTGTVTSVSGVAANGFTWSIATATTTPAITLTLQNATTAQSGQLTSTDWNTFNGKTTLAAVVAATNNWGGVNTFQQQYTYFGVSASNPGEIVLYNDVDEAFSTILKTSGSSGASRIITLPDATGTVLLTDGSGASLTGTASSLTAGAVTNGVYANANNSLTGNNTTTGSVMLDGEYELTPATDPSDASITGKNTLILYMADAYTVNLTNPTDGQLLFVSVDKDSPADAIISPVRNGVNATLTLGIGKSRLLRYRTSETTWYATE